MSLVYYCFGTQCIVCCGWLLYSEQLLTNKEDDTHVTNDDTHVTIADSDRQMSAVTGVSKSTVLSTVTETTTGPQVALNLHRKMVHHLTSIVRSMMMMMVMVVVVMMMMTMMMMIEIELVCELWRGEENVICLYQDAVYSVELRVCPLFILPSNGHIKTAEQRTITLHLVQQRGTWAGWSPTQSPHCCTKCNSPPINGQCTNFILFDVAL